MTAAIFFGVAVYLNVMFFVLMETTRNHWMVLLWPFCFFLAVLNGFTRFIAAWISQLDQP